MQTLPFDLIPDIGSAATLGLVVLQSDETLEQDFRRIFTARDVAIYVNRIPAASLGLVTPYIESIAAPVRDAFVAAGQHVTTAVTFGEAEEAKVARIGPDAIRTAARAV